MKLNEALAAKLPFRKIGSKLWLDHTKYGYLFTKEDVMVDKWEVKEKTVMIEIDKCADCPYCKLDVSDYLCTKKKVFFRLEAKLFNISEINLFCPLAKTD